MVLLVFVFVFFPPQGRSDLPLARQGPTNAPHVFLPPSLCLLSLLSSPYPGRRRLVGAQWEGLAIAESQEDVPVEGGPERLPPAFLSGLLPVCLLSCKGRWDQDLKGESSGAWRDFSSSHSFWQQDGPRRWIFVASLLKKPHRNLTPGINGWVLEKRE